MGYCQRYLKGLTCAQLPAFHDFLGVVADIEPKELDAGHVQEVVPLVADVQFEVVRNHDRGPSAAPST